MTRTEIPQAAMRPCQSVVDAASCREPGSIGHRVRRGLRRPTPGRRAGRSSSCSKASRGICRRRRLAPQLAGSFFVVCPDLRGYGRSTLPADAPEHAQSSKRAMAGDAGTGLPHRERWERAIPPTSRRPYAIPPSCTACARTTGRDCASIARTRKPTGPITTKPNRRRTSSHRRYANSSPRRLGSGVGPLRGFGLVRAGRGDLDPRWSRRRAHQQRREFPAVSPDISSAYRKTRTCRQHSAVLTNRGDLRATIAARCRPLPRRHSLDVNTITTRRRNYA
jgi:hypothetical protein